MAESERRNSPRTAASPSAGQPRQVNGATALPTRAEWSQAADGKYRFVEALAGTASVSISRERVFVDDKRLAEQFGSLIVVTTSNGDDEIRIGERRDGTLDINVNGEKFQISLGGKQKLAVRSGGGDDAIFASQVESDLLIDAGEGDDIVITGPGTDQIKGNRGNDTILPGSGNNYVEGGGGKDVIGIGGDGNDVVYAGDDDDLVMRGSGRGVKYVDGGRGNNQLRGGLDKTVFAPGAGKNQIVRGTKDDHVFRTDGIDRNLGSSIKIVGSPEFRERVATDLNTLRSSPVGRQMLGELDLAARTKANSVTITELTHENNGYAHGTGDLYLKGSSEGVVAGTGGDATINYNPSFSGAAALPIIVLYHELSHAYNIVTGTFQPGIYLGPGIDAKLQIPNRERQAVGLPNGGFNYGGSDEHPPSTSNPEALTENGFRKEIGVAPRPNYVSFASALSTVATTSAESTANYLNNLSRALTKGPEAVQKAFADLLASQPGQKFVEEGVSSMASEQAQLASKASPDLEVPVNTPKVQQSLRAR